nr:hypothetical protein GCM10020185_20960 [Pseudomonas brassicacearum subsp. brassicacearum]
MLVSLGGDLGQVSHRQHLAAFPQPAQQLADNFRGWATDAHVNFVEYQRRHTRGLRGDDLDGQADS